MNRISCVIFDLDGTLTQTNELIFASFNHVAGKYLQRTYSPPEIVSLFGPPEEVAIERIVGSERLDDAMDDFYAFYEQNHLHLARLHEGIRDVLDFLKGHGVLLAIFTGKGTRSTVITLEQIGIKQYFDLIVTGNDVVRHKPSSDGIRKVMNRFDLRPEEVLMVGDAVSDVKAAREAGVTMAAVVWDSYSKDKVAAMPVEFLFHTVSDFRRWLGGTLGGDGVVPH